MKFLFRSVSIGAKYKISIVAILWFVMAAAAVLAEVLRGPNSVNNWFIYKGVFNHTLQQVNLYAEYPSEYFDMNHYGPLFSLVVAPFALLPWWPGCIIWCLANAWFLYYAIMKLPLQQRQRSIILLVTAIEMMTSVHNVQFNPMLTAWIILAFVLVDKEKEGAATFFIAAGFFIKLYGIIALVSFLFSKHKIRFVLSFAFWMVVLFCLPMLISSPHFITQSYVDWYHAIIDKNIQNTDGTLVGGMQDISVQGMIRRMMRNPNFSQLWVLIPAGLLYVLPLAKIKAYRSQLFRLLYLALSLIMVVIFSSSAESPTYVIAVAGVGLWFVLQPSPPAKWAMAALVFVLLLTSLSATDLFPRFLKKNFIVAYSLKALPCLVVWLIIWWQLMRQKFYVSSEEHLLAGK